MLLAFRRVVAIRRHLVLPDRRTLFRAAIDPKWRERSSYGDDKAWLDNGMAPASPLGVPQRLRLVQEEIALATAAADRDPDSVKLVAVTKTVPPAVIEQAIEAGQRIFGENRVQEAHAKWPALKKNRPGIELHLIGPLQSNKVREAVALFDCVETVDRPKLARALAGEISRTGRRPRLFVQVNTGEEPQKAGVLPADADDFVSFCRADLSLSIEGLMCIPPVTEEPAMHFALLAKIAARLGIRDLSMGMSEDFARAIQFGATYVRIGTAIFGTRPAD
jgi:pyridoxal phosphate enzyme (YggS family)